MTEECSNTGSNTWSPTDAQLDWMRGELAQQFPHLNVAVEMREGTIYVDAVPA